MYSPGESPISSMITYDRALLTGVQFVCGIAVILIQRNHKWSAIHRSHSRAEKQTKGARITAILHNWGPGKGPAGTAVTGIVTSLTSHNAPFINLRRHAFFFASAVFHLLSHSHRTNEPVGERGSAFPPSLCSDGFRDHPRARRVRGPWKCSPNSTKAN